MAARLKFLCGCSRHHYYLQCCPARGRPKRRQVSAYQLLPRQQPARGNTPPPANTSNNPPQNQPASRDGFKPFTPPAGTANNNGDKNGSNTVNNSKTENNTTQGDQRQPMRYTPPVKAKDENYDVHPPLNQKPAEPQVKEAPKQEQKPAKENKKEDDKKKDDK